MRVAMGELGWPPSEAYWCDVNAITLAAQGQGNLLCRIGLLQRKDGTIPVRPPRDARGRPISFEQAFERRLAIVAASNAPIPGRRRPPRQRSSPGIPDSDQ